MFVFKLYHKYLLAFFVFMSAGLIQGEEDATEILRGLEKKFSSIKTVQTSVRQVKKLKIFDREVTLTGKIFLQNPGKLAWHVEKPVRYSIVIDGKILRQWDEDSDKVQKMSLSGNPVFKIISDQLTSWFSGRYMLLSKEYRIAVIKRDPVIVLEFVPHKEAMAGKVIKLVTVVLEKDARYVAEIRIIDISGDLTTFSFTETVLNKPIKPSIWKVRPSER
ncbi:MAG: outer membrane lipoprotein carrier protein LolA [Kiritimatiellae bacterium]|nr:outer membrane lipoprotein carrier protein LolA [Kiritimatiellia bacterium]